jgi:hypothetical protein
MRPTDQEAGSIRISLNTFGEVLRYDIDMPIAAPNTQVCIVETHDLLTKSAALLQQLEALQHMLFNDRSMEIGYRAAIRDVRTALHTIALARAVAETAPYRQLVCRAAMVDIQSGFAERSRIPARHGGA